MFACTLKSIIDSLIQFFLINFLMHIDRISMELLLILSLNRSQVEISQLGHEDLFLSLQTVHILMHHFIWVVTVYQSTCLQVSLMKRVNKIIQGTILSAAFKADSEPISFYKVATFDARSIERTIRIQ